MSNYFDYLLLLLQVTSYLAFSALTLLVGQQEGIRPAKYRGTVEVVAGWSG